MKTPLHFNKFGRALMLILAASAAPIHSVRACGDYALRARTVAQRHLAELARDAVAEDAAVSSPASAALRDAGPAGLQALFDAHADLITQHTTAKGSDPAWQ